MKKEGYKSLTGLRGQKPCKRFEGKRQKFALTLRPIEERQNSVWKVLKKWWTRETHSFLKTLYVIFDWSKIRFNRSKMPLIDPTAIEHLSKHTKLNQIFNRNFNQLRNKFDRSKFWKNQFFEKQGNFMQKLLRA